MNLGEIFIKLGLKSDGFEKGIDKAKKETNSFGDGIKKLGGILAGVFAIDTIKNFISSIIRTRSEFEKYGAVLTNSLGSASKARQEMAMLTDIAAQTPFSLAELTESYVKLVNYGLKPTKEEIIKLGDLASSTGKGFNQLVEAVADATTGQYERLKEFGIKAAQSGDKVTFTFKEQKTVVDNNSKSIKAYLLSLGELQGVSGSMAAISETLGGKISNLGDSWDKLLNTLGSASTGIFNTVISWAAKTLDYLIQISTTIDQMRTAMLDKATQSNVESALSEIDTMKKSLMGNGMSEKEAQEKALDLYRKGMQERIAIAQKSRKEGAADAKQALIDERDAVLKYYADLDKAKKGTTADKGKVYTDLLKSISDSQKALADLPKNSLAFYQAEIALLEARQLLITDPKILEQSKAEIALKKDYLDQLTKELKFIEAKKMSNKDVADLFSKGINTGTKTDTSKLVMSPSMKAGIYNSDKSADAYEKQIKRINDFNEELNNVIKSGMQSAAEAFGEGIGELMSGDMNMKDFGKSMLSAIGKFLVDFGKLIVAYALAAAGLDAAIKAPGAWPIALAAGIALIAAGSAISNMGAKGISGASNSSGGTSTGSTSSGTSNTTAANNKVVFEIKGTALVGVLNNVDRKNSLIR